MQTLKKVFQHLKRPESKQFTTGVCNLQVCHKLSETKHKLRATICVFWPLKRKVNRHSYSSLYSPIVYRLSFYRWLTLLAIGSANQWVWLCTPSSTSLPILHLIIIPMFLPFAIKLSLYCKKHIAQFPAPAFIAKSAIFILIKF